MPSGGEASKVAAAAAEAIAALLEANAPALKSLCITNCGLFGEHLEQIFGALRANTHRSRRWSACSTRRARGGGERGAFARRAVLPLVREENTTLQTLKWDGDRCGAVGEPRSTRS